MWDAEVASASGTESFTLCLFSDGPCVDTSGVVMDPPAEMAVWAVQASSAAGLLLASSDNGPLLWPILVTQMVCSATTICLHSLYGKSLRCQSVVFQVADPNSYYQWVLAPYQ